MFTEEIDLVCEYPEVWITESVACTSSQVLATYFGVPEAAVMAAIESLVSVDPSAGQHFRHCFFIEQADGEICRTYEMSREGFNMLMRCLPGTRLQSRVDRYLSFFDHRQAEATPGGLTPKFNNAVAVYFQNNY